MRADVLVPRLRWRHLCRPRRNERGNRSLYLRHDLRRHRLNREFRSERVLQAMKNLAGPRALVIRYGEHCRIAGRDVVRGDIFDYQRRRPDRGRCAAHRR